MENREQKQARLKSDPVNQPVRTARAIVHHYNSTQHCSTETVLLIFTFLQTGHFEDDLTGHLTQSLKRKEKEESEKKIKYTYTAP